MTERLTCRAPHPDAKQRLTCHAQSRRFAPRPCGWFLGHADQPMHWRATDRRPPMDPDGNDWRQCKSCGAWNCFGPDGA